MEEFEFGELGVEVGGDFGDAFEDLETWVFDVQEPRRMVWSWRRMLVTSPVSPHERHWLARRALIQ